MNKMKTWNVSKDDGSLAVVAAATPESAAKKVHGRPSGYSWAAYKIPAEQPPHWARAFELECTAEADGITHQCGIIDNG